MSQNTALIPRDYYYYYCCFFWRLCARKVKFQWTSVKQHLNTPIKSGIVEERLTIEIMNNAQSRLSSFSPVPVIPSTRMYQWQSRHHVQSLWSTTTMPSNPTGIRFPTRNATRILWSTRTRRTEIGFSLSLSLAYQLRLQSTEWDLIAVLFIIIDLLAADFESHKRLLSASNFLSLITLRLLTVACQSSPILVPTRTFQGTGSG